MSTILATEILQARRDVVLAKFKNLLDNSNHELWNAPINSKPYLITKLRKYQGQIEVQQQRSLANSSVANTIQQQQKWLIWLLRFLKNQSGQLNLLGLTKCNCWPNVRHNHTHQVKRNYAKRKGNQKQFPSSKQASSLTNSEVHLFPLPVLTRPDIPVGGRLTHFVEQWEELTDNNRSFLLNLYINKAF